MLFSAETGLDPRTSARALRFGVGVLRAIADQERARDALAKLGLTPDVDAPRAVPASPSPFRLSRVPTSLLSGWVDDLVGADGDLAHAVLVTGVDEATIIDTIARRPVRPNWLRVVARSLERHGVTGALDEFDRSPRAPRHPRPDLAADLDDDDGADGDL